MEGIYVDQQCTLLSQPEIACATTNPDLLSADPRETLEIMQKVYETIAKAKRDRRTVLKRLEDAENPNQRKSKRLLKNQENVMINFKMIMIKECCVFSS